MSINTARNDEWRKVQIVKKIHRILITKIYNLETYELPWMANLTNSDSVYQGRIQVFVGPEAHTVSGNLFEKRTQKLQIIN